MFLYMQFSCLCKECKFKPHPPVRKDLAILKEKSVSSFLFSLGALKNKLFWNDLLSQGDSSQLNIYTEVMALWVVPYLCSILRFRLSSLTGLSSSVPCSLKHFILAKVQHSGQPQSPHLFNILV